MAQKCRFSQAVFDSNEERKKVTDVFCGICAPKCLYKLWKKLDKYLLRSI
jgi:hypothetical protein